MNEERYHQIEKIFHKAADLEGEAREAFLVQACEGDEQLRREVEVLLDHDDTEDDSLLEKSTGIGRELIQGSPPHLERIGPYRILEKIGEGGMGTVYLAEQDHPRRQVAIKMIRSGLFSPGLLKRFRFEADVLGRLKHPGIAQIFEANEIQTKEGSLPYFVMEYVEGVELKRYAKESQLNVRARLELLARICDGVHHAHRKGIVHRDLKPENVLVIKAVAPTEAGVAQEFNHLGQPKILDFGVARATDSDVQVTTMLTEVGQFVGTLNYMSPEQVEGDSSQLDERSDIYALGVMLYELLAGRPPLDLKEKSIPEAGRIIREEEPTRLGSIQTDFRGDIDTITCKALEKDRDRRYASAMALATDIRRYLANEPIFAHPPSSLYQLKKFAKRHKGLMAGLALSFLILIAGIVFSLSFALRAKQGEADAQKTAYRFSITAAEAVGDANPYRALSHLEKIPKEYRGWEWRHLYARFTPHVAECEGAFCGIAFCSNGRLVTPRVRIGTIELVELPTDRVLAVFREAEELSCPALSPCGDWLVALAKIQKKLIVWNTSTRMRLKEIPALEPDIRRLSLSPKGAFITYLSSEKEFHVIETATGGKVMHRRLDYEYYNIAFDPKGARFALLSGRHIHLYALTGECLNVKKIGYYSLAFSPDGTRLALGEGRMIRIVDASTLEPVDALHGHGGGIRGLAFSPDGRRLASASSDNTIRIWNLESGLTEHVYIDSPAGSKFLAFSKDSKKLAAAHNNGIRLFALDLTARRVLEGHKAYVYQVTFSPNGALLASSGFQEKARLWNGVTGEPLAAVKTHAPQHFLNFTSDGSRLLIHDWDGVIIFDPAANRLITAPRTNRDELFFEPDFDFKTSAIPGARRCPDAGERFVLGPTGALQAEGTFRSNYQKNKSPEGEPIEEEILINDLASGKVIKRMGNYDCGVLAVAFSPDGKRLVSGRQNGIMNVWDLATGKELAVMKGHTSDVYSIDFSPDGSRIVSGGNDGMIILWDGKTYEQVLVLSGHSSYVHSVRFSPDGTLIASGSGDGTVRMWDSIPPSERWHGLKKTQKMGRKAQSMVDRLLKELGDPLDVADHLRVESSISDDLRQAALMVLLKRSKT